MNILYAATILIFCYIHRELSAEETQKTIDLVEDDIHMVLYNKIDCLDKLICDNIKNRLFLKKYILPKINRSARKIAKTIAKCAENIISLIEYSYQGYVIELEQDIINIMTVSNDKISQEIRDLFESKKSLCKEKGYIKVNTKYDPNIKRASYENMPEILDSFQKSISDFNYYFLNIISNIEGVKYDALINFYHQSLLNNMDVEQVLYKIDFYEDKKYYLKFLTAEKKKLLHYTKKTLEKVFKLKIQDLSYNEDNSELIKQNRRIDINATSYDNKKISTIHNIVKLAIDDESRQIVNRIKKHITLIQYTITNTLWRYYNIIGKEYNKVIEIIDKILHLTPENHLINTES